jgi:hypothetical protein
MEKRNSPLQQADRRSQSPVEEPEQNEAASVEESSSGSGNASSGEAAQPAAVPAGPATLTDDVIDEINWREVKKVMNRLNSRRSRDRQSCAMKQLQVDQGRLRYENENLRNENKQIREILRNPNYVNPRLRSNTHGAVNSQQTTHLPHNRMSMQNQSVSNNTIQQRAGYSLSYLQNIQGQQNQQNNRAVPPTQVNLQQHQHQFGFNQHQQAATPGGFIANPSCTAASSSTGGSQPESNSQQFRQVPNLNFQQSQQAGLNSIPGMIAGVVGRQPGLLLQNNDAANVLATFLSTSMQQASVHQQQTVQGGSNLTGFAGIPNNNSKNDIDINMLLQAALSATLLQQQTQNQNTVSQNSSSLGLSSSTGAAHTPNNGGGQGAGNSTNATYFNPIIQQNNAPNLDLGLLLESLGVPQQNQGHGGNRNLAGSYFQARSGQPDEGENDD